jgi:Flp pilus assembly protein TadD
MWTGAFIRVSFAFSALSSQGLVAASARELYLRTEYEKALAIVQAIPEKAAADWQLLGQIHFMKTDYKKATEAFEKATAAAPSSSEAWLWLGRAYGRRAETSSVFSAPGLASKSRAAFEKAVELDPRNKEALNDLFEFYVQAPGFLGGGEAKAQALIDKIAKLDPAERYFAEARLAENRKDQRTAEAKLRRAAEAAPQQIGRWIDLAKFLARHGRVEESETTFERAAQMDPAAPQLLFERAATYIEGKRNLETARTLLKRYLDSPLTPEHPSREEARRLLKQAGGA